MRCLIISDTTTHSKYWYYKYVQLLGGENILSPPLFILGGRRPSSPPRFLRLCLFSGTVPLLYNPVITLENEAINRPFSLEEVNRKLKNNKASGADNVINEFFKHCHNDCIQIIVDFFYIVLNTGFTPTEWCLGIVHPLFKNKCSVSDPDNYRGITLLSCT